MQLYISPSVVDLTLIVTSPMYIIGITVTCLFCGHVRDVQKKVLHMQLIDIYYVPVVFDVQLSVVGSGYHLLSSPHTAIIFSSGTRPSSHFNTITEPSVVAV